VADDIQSKAADLVKKVITVGVGTLFLTEESLRKLTSDYKLPKELITGILESATKTRKEFLQSFSREIMTRLTDAVDLKTIVEGFMRENEMEINLKVKFHPRSDRAPEDKANTDED